MRRGREPDLVVHDQMDRSAGLVAFQPREAKTFRHNALPCKSGVAMEEDWQNFHPIMIAQLLLFGAGLADHDGVNRLKV